jgi:hypothetical protein
MVAGKQFGFVFQIPLETRCKAWTPAPQAILRQTGPPRHSAAFAVLIGTTQEMHSGLGLERQNGRSVKSLGIPRHNEVASANAAPAVTESSKRFQDDALVRHRPGENALDRLGVPKR